jgi:hypothetical protein
MSRDFDVVVLTEDRYASPDPSDPYVAQMLREDSLVVDALRRRGLKVARISWASASFDWRQTACALFRSTWDYFLRIDEFVRWLDVASKQTRLLNDVSLVRWNLDKHYLLDLERSGIAIPKTRLLERGETCSLASTFSELGWGEAVLKPAISGAGRNTYRLNPANLAVHEAAFRRLIENEAMLLQEFRPEIVSSGESSLVFVEGRFSHAAKKTAKPGEFRVQDDHGGVAMPYEPGSSEIAFAEKVLAACPFLPLYARIDVVQSADGAWLLMEAELIEPELFFRFRPEATDALAAAIQRILANA